MSGNCVCACDREGEGERGREKKRETKGRDRGGGEEWKRKQREREISLIALVHPFPLLITFCQFRYIKAAIGNSLAVQWLGVCAFTTEAPTSILVQGTKILQVMQHGKEKKNSYLQNLYKT